MLTDATAPTPVPTPTDFVIVDVQPAALEPVMVYVVAEAGVANTEAPVVALSPVAGTHVYVAAPEAVIVTPEPPQLAAVAGVADSEGVALIVSVRST